MLLSKISSHLNPSKVDLFLITSSHDSYTDYLLDARMYYTHLVFHDWPNDACRKILCNIMSAMKPGYSKILVDDTVLPDRNYPTSAAAADLNMMAIADGMGRTRQRWITLLESVGL